MFGAGGRTYALVTAQDDDAVQLVRLSPASVAEVSSQRQNGSYKAGSEINVTVRFDEPVRLLDPRHPPSLLLSLDGAGSRTAAYLSGNGTDTLVFNYTVQPGDNAARLDYAHAGALTARGAVTDLYNHTADLGLPGPGAPGSLGQARAIAPADERLGRAELARRRKRPLRRGVLDLDAEPRPRLEVVLDGAAHVAHAQHDGPDPVGPVPLHEVLEERLFA